LIVVVETASLYNQVVKPLFIEPMDLSHCNWMYSILDGLKEQENKIFEEASYLFMKNYTFIDGDIRTLHMLAIPKQRQGLRTIRDLTAYHLPMLMSIRDKGYEAIKNKYEIDRQ
jgi:m7GpppX diphosphatase